jgi:hypothetical protein
LDRDWNNPNVYNPKPHEVVSGLFTHLQKNRFWQKDYGEWYWYLSSWDQGLLQISQISAYVPYSGTYCEFWADDHYGEVENFVSTANGNIPAKFERFYTEMNNYGLIRDEVAAMEGANYDDNVIYLKLATVLKNVIALQTVDLFNSIPYFNAFKGSEGIFFTPYDDPLEIYKSVIEEYRTIAGELPALYGKMSELAKNTLARQDLFFQGNTEKWVQYINAHTLKSCIRISGVAADYVKPILSEAIKDLPSEDFTFSPPQANENRIGISSGGIIQRGLWEQYYQLCVPDVIMTRINRGKDVYEPDIDDPRLPVLAIGYTETGKADSVEYYGVSGNWERNKYLRTLPVDVAYPLDSCRRNVYPQIAQAGGAQSNAIRPTLPMDNMVKACRWSYYNPITYVLSEAPLYLFSLAEVDLLLAETVLKGLTSTGKSAGQHIYDVVVHSTDFWYRMNAVSNHAGDMSDETKKILTPAKPAASLIDNYAGVIRSEFETAVGVDEKMEILMQQKYIHLNIWEPFECFTELRRTRHPKLEPITCYGSSTRLDNAFMMLERFKLPTSEKANNFEEYAKVMQDDLWGKPIFWVPQDKISEKYFLPEAIKPMLP